MQGLSPVGDSRCQRYTKTLAPSLLRSYTMSTPSSGSTGNCAGGERLGVHGDLGGMSEIQQQLTILSRQLGQLASRFADSKRQRTEEVATSATIQAAQKAEEERRKGQEVQEWNARMSSLQTVQIALETGSATTAVGSTVDVRQEQGKAAGYFQRTGPSGGPSFRRELTRRGLLDRLGQCRSARRTEDPYDGGESDVSVGFGSVEDRNHPDDDPMSESTDFGLLKGVNKWQISIFDGKTTSWRRFEMELLMAVRHLRLNSVLSGDEEEVPVAYRTISRDRLNAHYGNSEVAKDFAVWSLISSSLKTDANKRVFFSTKSPVAFFFFFNITYSRWTSSLPSCLWSLRIFPSLPGSCLTICLSRCKFSTLTTRQPMVEFYLLTFPRFPWLVGIKSLLFVVQKPKERSYSLADRSLALAFSRGKTLPSSSARSWNCLLY